MKHINFYTTIKPVIGPNEDVYKDYSNLENKNKSNFRTNVKPIIKNNEINNKTVTKCNILKSKILK